MIYFKINGRGYGVRDIRIIFPIFKKISTSKFRLVDLPPNTFSKSIMKRLESAKTHGLKIKLRQGRNYSMFIEVINKEDQKVQNKELKRNKNRIKKLLNDPNVQEYISLSEKII